MAASTREQAVTLAEGRIYTKTWQPVQASSAVPVILVHDSLGSVQLWRDFPRQLCERLSRPILAYDRLGFGQSDARSGPAAPGFVSDEARRVFPAIKAQLDIERFILLGHSVGGGISITVAARDPDCAAVITLAAQAFVEERTLRGIRAAKAMFEQSGQVDRLKKWHGDKAAWVLAAWTDVWLSPEFSNWNLRDSLHDASCPILAIHGDEDEYGSVAFPEFICEHAAGNAQMQVLKHCGHSPHLQHSGAVLALIQTFIDQHA